MENLRTDIRFALRQMQRAPAFALFVIATLAIGIGANTTIFSALNALLLRPLPYVDGHQLVSLTGAYEGRGDDWSVSLPNAADWRDLNRTFTSVGYHQNASLTLAGDGAVPERVQALRVSREVFQLLDVQPAQGRSFTAEELVPDGPRAVVLTDALWRRRFGADPAIVGSSIQLSGNPYTVIGIMPRGFSYPNHLIEMYVPLQATPQTWNRASGGLQVIGRLEPDVSLADAQADLDRVSAALAEEYPGTNKDLTAHLQTLRSAATGGRETATTLIILATAVGLVLLIACVNVANLLLARATAREREVAVRAAMGAARWRVMRQFLTESLLLAAIGGTAGTLIAIWGTNALPTLIPEGAGITRDFALDGRVLAFTTLVTALTGVLFGIAPAIKAATPQLSQLLGGRTGASTRDRGTRRNLLVVVEVALAIILLISAGIMARSFATLVGRSPGFETANLLTMRVSFDARYKEAQQVATFQQRMLDNLSGVNGVKAATTADFIPISGTNNFNDVAIEGQAGREPVSVGSVMVGPDYVQAMGIAMLRGSAIDARDNATGVPVVMVNKAFADKHFPGQDPIGKRILFGWEGGEKPNWRTIKGVFGNVLHGGLDDEQRTEVYAPIAQLPWAMGSMNVVVRTEGEPTAALTGVRDAIARVDPALAIYDVRSMERMIHDSDGVLIARILAGALALFGGIALLLAAIGLYGVISYSVAQRTFEIGVRAALGADTTRVLSMVLRHGMVLVACGLGLGIVGAFFVTRLLSGLLHGVTPTDPVSFAGMSLVLIAVAFLASVIPARRAARIDPMIALRTE